MKNKLILGLMMLEDEHPMTKEEEKEMNEYVGACCDFCYTGRYDDILNRGTYGKMIHIEKKIDGLWVCENCENQYNEEN